MRQAGLCALKIGTINNGRKSRAMFALKSLERMASV
jgi:hypothetical protein